MIQGLMNLNPFEKDMFYKESENSKPVEMLIQSVVLHLVYFEKGFEKACLCLTLLSNQLNRLIRVFKRLIF